MLLGLAGGDRASGLEDFVQLFQSAALSLDSSCGIERRVNEGRNARVGGWLSPKYQMMLSTTSQPTKTQMKLYLRF